MVVNKKHQEFAPLDMTTGWEVFEIHYYEPL
jgi:hypothetical protein